MSRVSFSHMMIMQEEATQPEILDKIVHQLNQIARDYWALFESIGGDTCDEGILVFPF